LKDTEALGQSSFTDLNLADDVSLLAEMLELLVPILKTMASEVASIGLEVNGQKTKVQSLGCREDMPLTIKAQCQDIIVVDVFVYLGFLIHSTTGSTCDTSHHSAITHAAMQVTSRHLNKVEAVQHVHFTKVQTAGRYQRRTHVRSMHSTSGVCVCCLASNGTNLYGG